VQQETGQEDVAGDRQPPIRGDDERNDHQPGESRGERGAGRRRPVGRLGTHLGARRVDEDDQDAERERREAMLHMCLGPE
jgi:hypothetical protein